MTIALAICFYRDIGTLLRTLDSIAAQTRKPDEVIIADDGSDRELGGQISEWSNRSELPLVHAWHPKFGFRQSEMRNKAALLATSEHVVYVDHDCLLSHGFIQNHLSFAKDDRVQQGPRINVMPPDSETFRPEPIPMLRAFAAKHLYEWRSAIRGNKVLPRPPEVICGCNLLVPRKIINEINGFDEDFRSWGYEDAEFVVRAWHAGFGMHLTGLGTTVFHLYHPSRATIANRARFEACVATRRTSCRNGISRHAREKVRRVREGKYTRVEFPD